MRVRVNPAHLRNADPSSDSTPWQMSKSTSLQGVFVYNLLASPSAPAPPTPLLALAPSMSCTPNRKFSQLVLAFNWSCSPGTLKLLWSALLSPPPVVILLILLLIACVMELMPVLLVKDENNEDAARIGDNELELSNDENSGEQLLPVLFYQLLTVTHLIPPSPLALAP